MRIGISGHQELGSAFVFQWLRRQIITELEKADFTCGISSLATGADQLFSEITLNLGKQLEVVIPCQRYETTFDTNKSKMLFRDLLSKASRSYLLDFDAPSEEAFYEAGKAIVDGCDSMLFIWNGKPAQGLGGTGDIVDYAVKQGRHFVWLNPADAQ